MVEGSGFENRRTGNGTRGSNPFSSAEKLNRVRGLCAGTLGSGLGRAGPFGLLDKPRTAREEQYREPAVPGRDPRLAPAC